MGKPTYRILNLEHFAIIWNKFSQVNIVGHGWEFFEPKWYGKPVELSRIC
jgi:hypothetical protein